MFSEECFSNSFQIERNTIVVTVFLLFMNPTEFRLVHNQKENCNLLSIWKELEKYVSECKSRDVTLLVAWLFAHGQFAHEKKKPNLTYPNLN